MIKGWGALFCFSAGTLLFQCWHSFVSVLALRHSGGSVSVLALRHSECFSAGTLAQGGTGIFAFECFSAGTQALRVFQCWHSGTQGVFGVVFQCWHSGTRGGLGSVSVLALRH